MNPKEEEPMDTSSSSTNQEQCSGQSASQPSRGQNFPVHSHGTAPQGHTDSGAFWMNHQHSMPQAPGFNYSAIHGGNVAMYHDPRSNTKYVIVERGSIPIEPHWIPSAAIHNLATQPQFSGYNQGSMPQQNWGKGHVGTSHEQYQNYQISREDTQKTQLQQQNSSVHYPPDNIPPCDVTLPPRHSVQNMQHLTPNHYQHSQESSSAAMSQNPNGDQMFDGVSQHDTQPVGTMPYCGHQQGQQSVSTPQNTPVLLMGSSKYDPYSNSDSRLQGGENPGNSRTGEGSLKVKVETNEDDIIKQFENLGLQDTAQEETEAGQASLSDQPSSINRQQQTKERSESTLSTGRDAEEERKPKSSVSGEFYQMKFLLRGLPKSLGEDTLSNYVEVAADCEVKKIEYTSDKAAAVITVDAEPVWNEVEEAVGKRTLEKKKVSFSRLTVAQSICIWNVIYDNDQDLIQDYFENPKSGNTEKTAVTEVYIKDNMTVVTFEDKSAVEKVLSKKSHSLGGKNLDISMYYKDIGPVCESSKFVVQDSFELSVGESRLLRASGYLDKLKNDLPNLMEVEMQTETNIVMRGTKKDLEDASDKITSFKESVKTCIVEFSAQKMKYLESESGGEYMLKRLRKSGIEGAWVCWDKTLKIVATSQSDLGLTQRFIKRHLKEEKVYVPTHVDRSIISSSLSTLKVDLQKRYGIGSFNLEYDSTSETIFLVAQDECSSDVLKSLISILPTPVCNVSVEETFQKDIVRFFQRYELSRVQSKYATDVSIEKDGKTIVINGQKDRVNETLKEIQGIVKKVVTDILPLGYKSSRILLQSEYLLCLERHVEGNGRCVINHKVQEVLEDPLGATGGAGVGAESFGMGESSRRPLHGKSHGHGGGHGHGRGHGHGLGCGTSQAGEHHQENRDQEGDQAGWKQKTGRRRHRKFVHGTKIQITLKNTEIAKEKADIIVNTVTQSFDLQRGALSKSIAKAGGDKLKSECSSKKHLLVEGSYVVTYGGNLSCKYVFHCCLPPSESPTAGESLESLMSQMLLYADKMLAVSVAIPALGTGGLGYDPGVVANTMYKSVREYSDKHPETNIKEVRFVIFDNPNVMKAFTDVENQPGSSVTVQTGGTSTYSGICPVLLPGEIAKQKVDIIVNPSNNMLLLSGGAVSKSILQHGGDSIQKECDKHIIRYGNLLAWEFKVTSGGNLKCRKIYHCFMPVHSSFRAEDKLKEMVLKMLESAQKYKNNSIAFPALGTGNLGYPKDVVANILYKVVGEFWKKNPDTTLKDVRFIIYPADQKCIEAFKNAERAFKGTSASSQSPLGAQITPQVPPRATDITVCSMKVKVKQGDITKEKVEAIFNPINPDMSLKTGSVSRALLKIGGSSFENNTKLMESRLKDERIASVLMTSGVQVFHVDRNFIKANQKQAILACLKSADKLDMKTVAFPILQAGQGETVVQMAEDLYAALHQLSKMPNPTVIEEVRVVIFQEGQYCNFVKKLKTVSEENPFPREPEDQSPSEPKKQITFTVVSDSQQCRARAKETLNMFSDDKQADVKTIMKLPPSVSKEDINLVGLNHTDVHITLSLGPDQICLEGEPVKVLQAIEDFQNKFKYNIEEWQARANEEIGDDMLFSSQDKHHLSTSQNTSDHREPISKKKITSSTGDTAWNSDSQSHETGVSDGKSFCSSTSHQFGQGSVSNNQKSTMSSWHGGHHGTKGADPMSKRESRKTSSLNYDQTESIGNIARSVGKELQMGSPPKTGSMTDEDYKPRQRSPNMMKWFYIDPENDTIQAYENISRDIEESYVEGKDKHGLPEDTETKEQYLIDFKTMEEYPEANPDDKVAVLRREEVRAIRDHVLPSSWDQMDDKDEVKVVALKQSDQGYENVKKEIIKTCGKFDVSILKIERVQNKEMYYRYHDKKKSVSGENQRRKEDSDQTLWYRCNTTDSIVPINNFGMNLNYCRQYDCDTLGEGLAFSKAFEKIVKRDVDGSQYAYLCKVLVGNYTKGETGLRDPPAHPGDDRTYFHSVVDNVMDPSIFMVFSDAQVYPQYLVTYRLITEQGAAKP